ncbi:MAG: hypothetical protein QMC80_06920 [Thermoplasmatales archaeon]|nr:hypothetical protein [Thermoplasmatales archaeon]
MNPTMPKTYRVIKGVLMSNEFTQLEIHKEIDISLGQVNSVVKWLESRDFVEKIGRRYRVVDPAGIISVFPLFRNMKDNLIGSLNLRRSMDEIIEKLPEKCILCLDSALENYSKYFRIDRICVYGNDDTVNLFKPWVGGKTPVNIYKPDMNVEDDVVSNRKRATSKLRTVIDLACDRKIYLAKDLLKDLWGLEIE